MTRKPIRTKYKYQSQSGLKVHDIKQNFVQFISQKFPTLGKGWDLNVLIADGLLSPHAVKLPRDILTQAQNFVRAAFALRESRAYQRLLDSQLHSRDLIDPGNKSILMSYDFHLDEKSQLKLIEINTNAAFLALGELMYEFHKLPRPIQNFNMDEIRENILEELDLFGKPNTRPEVSIVDENPQSQRLFIEFLVYFELMKEWGFQPTIKDIAEVSGNEDLIYNRYTDFYLDNPSSKALRTMYREKRVCFSPNPYEYLLLADKERLIDWWRPGFLENVDLLSSNIHQLKQHNPLCFQVNLDSAERAWSERKHLFFKPMRSFGAKQSFKGAKISRKAFDELLKEDFIAQEFVAAPEMEFSTPTGPQSFKYDLRFYAYKDRVQSVVARIYQGQVTNLRTEGGGFAPVVFST